MRKHQFLGQMKQKIKLIEAGKFWKNQNLLEISFKVKKMAIKFLKIFSDKNIYLPWYLFRHGGI